MGEGELIARHITTGRKQMLCAECVHILEMVVNGVFIRTQPIKNSFSEGPRISIIQDILRRPTAG